MSYPDAYIVEICMGGTSGAQVGLAQVGLGSEYVVDRIGSRWFYCNLSNNFGQKCLFGTTDLSHATAFLHAKLWS